MMGAWTHKLVRWSGALLPVPTLAGVARTCEVIGTQADVDGAREGEILADDGLDWGVDAVWRLAVIPASSGGSEAEIHPLDVLTIASDALGNVITALPNAPTWLRGELDGDNRPLLRWVHSRFREAAQAAEFGIYACDEGGSFDWSDPLDSVAVEPGKTRYAWLGEAISAPQHYCVRALDADEVRSLIPRSGRSPCTSYETADLGRLPLLRPQTPPSAAPQIRAEVL